jgi:curved DNA-binding protein CbpA
MVHKDYYMTLGVLPDAEDIVIKAAYKALVQRYHPDRYKGDAAEAQRRTAELNEAYEVLSNPSKRAEYDRERASQQNGFTSDFDEPEEDDSIPDMLEQDWALALEYYPDLKTLESRLRRISVPLAIGFRQLLLSTKDFEKRIRIAQQLEKRFLESYFGTNTKLIEFATKLIMDGKRDAAKELNKIVSVLGSKIDAQPIIDKLYAKYYQQEIAKKKTEEVATSQFDKKLITSLLTIAFAILMIAFIANKTPVNLKTEQQRPLTEQERNERYDLWVKAINDAKLESKEVERQPPERQRTGLEWAKCDIGQTWNGAACDGKTEEMSWNEANSLKATHMGKSDWRLPTIEELQSIPYSSCNDGIVYWSSNNKNTTASVFSCSVRGAAEALKDAPKSVRLVRNAK